MQIETTTDFWDFIVLFTSLYMYINNIERVLT